MFQAADQGVGGQESMEESQRQENGDCDLEWTITDDKRGTETMKKGDGMLSTVCGHVYCTWCLPRTIENIRKLSQL